MFERLVAKFKVVFFCGFLNCLIVLRVFVLMKLF